MLHGRQDQVATLCMPDWEVVMPSIFIQIPSYRDWELPKTVADAVAKATGTNFLTFGIHNCVMADDAMTIGSTPDWARVCLAKSIAPEHIGLQMSRYIANAFYINEDYYLQIDSHMRFVQDWDIKLIAMHKSYRNMGIFKPLITMYPAEYWYDDDGNEVLRESYEFNRTRISFAEKPQQFSDSFIPSQTAVSTGEGCVYTPSVSGGFIFADGSFHLLTPNKKIAFWGEEILIAARAFTHGFDLVTATEDIVYHLYHSGQPFEKTHRHHAWVDFPELWRPLDRTSKLELQHIFSQNLIGEGALGSVRTLAEYGEFAGLDFVQRIVIMAR